MSALPPQFIQQQSFITFLVTLQLKKNIINNIGIYQHLTNGKLSTVFFPAQHDPPQQIHTRFRSTLKYEKDQMRGHTSNQSIKNVWKLQVCIGEHWEFENWYLPSVHVRLSFVCHSKWADNIAHWGISSLFLTRQLDHNFTLKRKTRLKWTVKELNGQTWSQKCGYNNKIDCEFYWIERLIIVVCHVSISCVSSISLGYCCCHFGEMTFRWFRANEAFKMK